MASEPYKTIIETEIQRERRRFTIPRIEKEITESICRQQEIPRWPDFLTPESNDTTPEPVAIS
jgi:hypothetical protein